MSEKPKRGRPRIHPIKDPNRIRNRGGKGIPKAGKGAKGVLRPHTWATGEDPIIHEMFGAWHVSRAQYTFRTAHGLDTGKWLISFEEYCELWKGRWNERGRKADDYCISRKDYEDDWTKENMEIIQRKEHNRKQAERKMVRKWGHNKMHIHQAKMAEKRNKK